MSKLFAVGKLTRSESEPASGLPTTGRQFTSVVTSIAERGEIRMAGPLTPDQPRVREALPDLESGPPRIHGLNSKEGRDCDRTMC